MRNADITPEASDIRNTAYTNKFAVMPSQSECRAFSKRTCPSLAGDMRMKRSAFIALILLVSTVSCVPTPTPSPSISEQEAIAIAIKNASMSSPGLSGAKIPPENVHAEQMTLAVAVKRLTGNDDVGAGYDPNMTVWLVSMEGIWTSEFPRPTGWPTLQPYHHFAVILNAKTGEEIGSSARP